LTSDIHKAVLDTKYQGSAVGQNKRKLREHGQVIGAKHDNVTTRRHISCFVAQRDRLDEAGEQPRLSDPSRIPWIADVVRHEPRADSYVCKRSFDCKCTGNTSELADRRFSDGGGSRKVTRLDPAEADDRRLLPRAPVDAQRSLVGGRSGTCGREAGLSTFPLTGFRIARLQ
jgi:hypothetical protein